MKYMDYLKTEKFPLFWCKGCGNGTVLGAIVRAFEELDMTLENTVVVTGIGCWGKADDYLNTNALHGTHGRALAFATGVKLANPTLDVIVLMGDGDCATIGGNHFIHACRRNVDVTAIMVNNYNYGMTGGQYSGTTPTGSVTTTSRMGHVEQAFDICALAIAAGAPFVARASADDPVGMKKLIVEGIKRKSMSFIEIIAACPTHFGRNNALGGPVDMLKAIRARSVTPQKALTMSSEELSGKIIMGTLSDMPSKDYSTLYAEMSEKVQEGVK